MGKESKETIGIVEDWKNGWNSVFPTKVIEIRLGPPLPGSP